MSMGEERVVMETDVLILGSGAAGCGAAFAAKERGARVLVLDKGKLESSGNLGGGNDHFCAALNSGPETDTEEAFVNFMSGPLSGLPRGLFEKGWAQAIPPVLAVLEEVGVELIRNEDGSYLRTVGFGQPGNWWIHIRNGHNIKRLIAKKMRTLGIDILDHVMVTKLLRTGGQVSGCVGFDVLDGRFYVFRAKKVITALGRVTTRGWTNSTGNPYNIWFSPYNTGSHFVLAYNAGVRLFNLDTEQKATLLPKGFGAPGMNGINSMGGRELNALGERFMGKYDPMWENGVRRNQISGTYREMVEGKGPPFYMDMTQMDKDEVRHLQYVLMPGDKATYLDYCEQKGIDFAKSPLEVEISELSFCGQLVTDENGETNVGGLFNGCLFPGFSGAMCGGYYAGGRAAEASAKIESLPELDETEVMKEKDRIFGPTQRKGGIDYKEFEGAVRQVMNYYMGYRRNQKGMELALEKLNFLEGRLDQIRAPNHHELMKANESAELLKMCQLATRSSIERKESGRTFYARTDYPALNRDLAKPLLIWQENGAPRTAWGV